VSLIVCNLIRAYSYLIFARVIVSWFPISPGSGLASVYSFLYSATEPILGPIRRIIPPLGMGGMGLDLSPLVVFFLIQLLVNVIC
jgi:YggT family protein